MTVHRALSIKMRKIKQPCQICNRWVSGKNGMSFHHIRGRNRKGRVFNRDFDKRSNLTWLCLSCHNDIHRVDNFYCVITPSVEELL